MQRRRKPREPRHGSSGQPLAHGPARLNALVYSLKFRELAWQRPRVSSPGLCQTLLHISRSSLRSSGDTHQLACGISTIKSAVLLLPVLGMHAFDGSWLRYFALDPER